MQRKIIAMAMFLCIPSMLFGIPDFVFGEDDISLEKIVVTPSRTSENIKGTTSDVTVFRNEGIKESNETEVKDIIRETLGTDVVQTGSFGGTTSVFLRGTNSGQSRIMIDNVRVYDPIDTNASYDMAHLTIDNVDRIEVVR
ncbi:MAG: TonB-dependent receptor plug domain-containing protein, partial [Candidatus Omnitrophica bacterium]|nr:TonB-dependent receptor plug domain-containing protein [Candidatus Omnitrophota bacterium]